MKAAPTCFGLEGNHHQGATTSNYLKLQAWFSVGIDVVQMLFVRRPCIHIEPSV